MRPTDRVRLTAVLREHVAHIATDLRGQLRPPGPARERAQKLWADEQVGEDFDVWTDLLSRRAAVLWVLKSVYVRVLEDKGLLSHGRLLDPESQQLFEKLAPNLGESAFLRWVYRDLGSAHGGLPELFAPQPAEVSTPSDEYSRALIEFWRHRDADSGAHWSFAEERFEGELMGDLYQELDPVVKERYALCQTPDFVRAFILDRTLTPALETFGADKVRLLDPACGSGHFLIDGLKRLVAATREKHSDWEPQRLVRDCLARVVGIDLNDYACALARARLVMTAAELAGVFSLAQASTFHPQVYWADGLEQVEKGKDTRGHQLSLLEPAQNEVTRASLTRPEVRAALGKVLEPKFHAVVANPPYITEKDRARKEYHREKVGKRQRYVSAYREYSLASPFTERCFQLATSNGFIGLITSSTFMKREFGKPLIEEILAGLDLTLIVDTSHADIPYHATPTVLLFGRNRAPSSNTVRVVMGRRGEPGTLDDPSKGLVWASINAGWSQPGFENEFVTVADLTHTTFNKHPWILGGGGAAQLKTTLDQCSSIRLGDVAQEVGFVCMTRADDIYVMPRSVLERLQIDTRFVIPTVEGDKVRDWSISDPNTAIFPYDENLKPVAESVAPLVHRTLWTHRTMLWLRREPNGNHKDIGLTWWEWSRFQRERFRSHFSIAFAFVATHNHFVLDRGGKVFNRSAPVIQLPLSSTEEDYLALLGILNSSVACFWMKQVFYPKGSKTKDLDKEGTLPENNRYEIACTGLLAFPLPLSWQDRNLVELSRQLDTFARQRQLLVPDIVLSNSENLRSVDILNKALLAASEKDDVLRRKMVYLQEELDWLVYRLYGLYDSEVNFSNEEIEPEHRPFCRELQDRCEEMSDSIRPLYIKRREDIDNNPNLALIETAVFKRPWRGTQGVFGRYDHNYEEKAQTAMTSWLAAQVEAAVRDRGQAVTIEQVVASIQSHSHVLVVAEVLTRRRDFSLVNLTLERLQAEAVSSNRLHVYTTAGCLKRDAWERTWEDQKREDAGEIVTPDVPPQYASSDFLRAEYWQLRGKLDVPKERFIAFTEVPGRDANSTLYGWAGWTPVQRLKALLSIDEELEDSGVPLADRIGVLDSAWRLLPDVAREDPAVANRLKAELQALVGIDGPSREQLEAWRQRFPPPGTKAARAAGKKSARG